MHRYEARIAWQRNGAVFSGNRCSRVHEWSFDGGAKVAASASPSVVPPRTRQRKRSIPKKRWWRPSSCQVLWFLSIASKRGFVVESYVDEAFGVMEKKSDGKLAISRITLRPRIQFSGDRLPSPAELQSLHHSAHDHCLIANSLKSEVVVEPG